MAVTRNRKIGIAVAGGALVAGVFAASAASLGTLTTTNLGTTAAVVAACDTDGIGVTWGGSSYLGVATGVTPPSSTAGSTYNLTTLTLTGVDAACNTQNYKVTLAGANGTAIATATPGVVAVAPAGVVVTFPSAVDTKAIEQITAKTEFSANLAVIGTAGEMTDSLLDILA